jgi:hypothetical protein
MRDAVLIAVSVILLGIVGCGVQSSGDPRKRAEREQGIALPLSARSIQCRGDASRGFLDRGAAVMFEMSTNDFPSFVARLSVRSRAAPAIGAGDPTVNGYNVWPPGSPTFVPGNAQYAGFRRTWQGSATPVEMLTCSSSTGDWLHVEFWRLEGDGLLVKMYTDWN